MHAFSGNDYVTTSPMSGAHQIVTFAIRPDTRKKSSWIICLDTRYFTQHGKYEYNSNISYKIITHNAETTKRNLECVWGGGHG